LEFNPQNHLLKTKKYSFTQNPLHNGVGSCLFPASLAYPAERCPSKSHFYARKGLTPLIWRERSTAEFPMMSFLSISFSASAAGRDFILTGAYDKMSSSETESTASDMSDFSYEQDIGEVGEVDEVTLQHCRKLTT
jgi:hypothetical protein